ncbi:glycosyltransferase [Tenacibaculum halocynthiae]|uniref:glycosyltransferase n=1 Tax=Tenacibaculum halocynthiae TaxID=1254437 RepID=UPI00389435FE
MKKKIIFFLPSLKAGGAERVISFLVERLDKDLFNCKLIVLGFEKDAVYSTEKIDVTYLNKNRLLKAIPSIIKVILKDKPNVVFSSIQHVNLLMGLLSFLFRNVVFIAREASVISAMNNYVSHKKILPKKINRLIYSRFSKIVCQSLDMKNDFINNFKLSPNKLKVINNPITKNSSLNYNREKPEIINFITIGRLSKEKGHERVLKALSKIKDYNYNYRIIGSGKEEEQIKELARNLDIDNNIIYIPFTKNVLKYLYESDFFIQGSYVEGFPNALLESCSVGTPVLAYNCPGGTKEIIENGINGYFFDSEKDFEEKLIQVHKEGFNRQKVIESVNSKFSSKIILEQYKELFLSV